MPTGRDTVAVSGRSDGSGSRSGSRYTTTTTTTTTTAGPSSSSSTTTTDDYDARGAGVNEETLLLDAGDGDVDGSRKYDSPGPGGNNPVWTGLDDFEGLPWWKKPSIRWLLGPYALVTLAFGGTLVPKLDLLIQLVCERYFADRSASDPNFTYLPVIFGQENPQCRIPEVQRSVATFMLTISVLTGLLSSLTAPKLGALSDRYGRRRLLVLVSLGGILSEIVTILAAKYPDTIHYKWMLLGAFFDGIAGSFTAASVLIHSYTSDCTPPSRRGVAIGYLHSCLFTGLALGPFLAGEVVRVTHSLLSIFYITLGCHIFFVIYMRYIIPESLSKKRQLIAREKHALENDTPQGPVPAWAASVSRVIPFGKHLSNAMRSLRSSNPFTPLKILFPSGPGNARLRRNLLLLAGIDTVVIGAAMSSGQVIVLYVQYIFGWDTVESSRFISLVSFVRVFVLMALFPVINYIFRIRPEARRRRESGVALVESNAGADKLDIWILRTALVSDVVGIVGYIFVRSSALFVLCAVITAFGGLGSATIQASLSKHVPAERVGQLLGAIGLLHALSRIVAPVIFNGIYAATIESYPQAFYVLLAVIFVAALVGSFLIRPHVFMVEDDKPAPSAQEGSPRARRDSMDDDVLLPGLL